MNEPKRTPGQAEGTEKDAENALEKDPKRRQERAADQHQQESLEGEPGRTPEQAEGTEEQAEGSLRHQNQK